MAATSAASAAAATSIEHTLHTRRTSEKARARQREPKSEQPKGIQLLKRAFFHDV